MLNISSALKNPEASFSFSQTLEIPDMTVLDDPVSFRSARVDGQYRAAGESISVLGNARATVVSRCAKCLKAVVTQVDAPLDEVFVKELASEDDDRYQLDGHMLDLEPMAREALILALPIRFLCGEACRGLCPNCGINRNDASCTCQEGGERLNPFSALSELLTKDEEV